MSLTESTKLLFFFFKPHRQIFFKKSCFFVSIRGIEGVLDTGVWTLDRSRQYFSSKISIAKSLFFLFHFFFFSRCEMWYINSGKWKCVSWGHPRLLYDAVGIHQRSIHLDGSFKRDLPPQPRLVRQISPPKVHVHSILLPYPFSKSELCKTRGQSREAVAGTSNRQRA